MDEPADEIKDAFDRIFREMDEAIQTESLMHHEQRFTCWQAGASTGWLDEPTRISTSFILAFQTRSNDPETRKLLDTIADEDGE